MSLFEDHVGGTSGHCILKTSIFGKEANLNLSGEEIMALNSAITNKLNMFNDLQELFDFNCKLLVKKPINRAIAWSY